MRWHLVVFTKQFSTCMPNDVQYACCVTMHTSTQLSGTEHFASAAISWTDSRIHWCGTSSVRGWRHCLRPHLPLPFTQWNLVLVSMTLQMFDKLQKRFGAVPHLVGLSGSASTRMNGMSASGCSYLGFLSAFDCCRICVCDLSWQPHPVGEVSISVSLAVASIRVWSRDC